MAVTPHAGVWIEIGERLDYLYRWSKSLPTRECGLKYVRRLRVSARPAVTPHAGVWIEMKWGCPIWQDRQGHSPRGSVD